MPHLFQQFLRARHWQFADFQMQHFLIQKRHGVAGILQPIQWHFLLCQMIEKGTNLDLAHLVRMPLVMKQNEVAHPFDMSLRRFFQRKEPSCLVQELIEQPRRLRRRTAVARIALLVRCW